MTKPIYAVYILLHGDLPLYKEIDFLDQKTIKKAWPFVKKILKERTFFQQLREFDPMSVSQKQVTMIENIFRNDHWMAYGQIMRMSRTAA